MGDGRSDDEDRNGAELPQPPDAELPSDEEEEAKPAPPSGWPLRADPAAPPVQVVAPRDWPPADRELPLGPPEPPAPPKPAQVHPPDPTRPKRRRSLLGRLFGWLVKGIAIFVIASVLLVLAYRFVAPPLTLTMIGDWVSGRGVTRQWMPLSRIDPDMARAAIAAEDSGFCEHNGFDLKAIEQAYARNQRGGRIRGGSTISQQTAKNVFLWQGGGYFRKGLEAWFTFLIENLWGKQRIMEVYLNVAETGIGTYGVNAGSIRYFGHDASQMTPREAAQIAAVLPLPKRRAGIAPKGFTRRYGNSIAARIAVVRNDGLDACIR